MAMMLLDNTPNSKEIKVLSKNIKDTQDEESKDIFENIVTELLEEAKDDSSKSFLLQKLLNLSSGEDIKEGIFSKFSAEELTVEVDNKDKIVLDELIKLAMVLKNNLDDTKVQSFPTNSKELKPLLDSKVFMAEIKSATNIKELLDVADKFKLNVKNFQFFNEEIALDTQNKQAIKELKSADIFKLIDTKFEKKTMKLVQQIKENNPKEHILKNILSTITDSKTTNTQKTKYEIKVADIKDIVNDKKIDSKIDIKNRENKLVIDEVKVEKILIKKESDTIKTIQVSKTVNSENIVKNTVQVVSKKELKIEEKSNTKDNNEPRVVKKDEIVSKIDRYKTNIMQEVKKVDIKPIQNNLLNSIKVQENSEGIVASDTAEIQSDKPTVQKLDLASQTQKTSHDKQPVEFKRTFDSFATDFKEKVEAYKSPLMKVKMQLNPMGLGEVDVTIINRGNNLHINVNSNQSTIAIFSQNQAEFKTSLVNMGFNELSMNFSDSKNQKDQQQQKKSKDTNDNFNETSEELDSFELITPRYV